MASANKSIRLGGLILLRGLILTMGSAPRAENGSVCFGQSEFFLVLRVEGAILHVPETAYKLMVFIDAPYQPDGELVHHRILHEQIPPGLNSPKSAGGQRQLKAHLLAGHRDLHLLLHLLEFLVGRSRLRLIVPLPRRRKILQLLAALVEDLYLQRCGDGHCKLALSVVKNPLHVLIEAQIGHDPVRKLLGGDAQLGGCEIQSASGSRPHLLELELPGDAVHRQKRLRQRIQRQRLHGLRGYGASGGLRPFLNLVLQLVHDLRAAVDGCGIEHPPLLGLRPALQPLVEKLVGIDRKLMLVQSRRKGFCSGVHAQRGHGGIAEENGLKVLLRRLLPALFMYLGKWCLIGPGQSPLLAPLMELLHQILLRQGAAPCRLAALYLQKRLQQSLYLAVLFLFQRRGKHRGVLLVVPLCQHLDSHLPLRRLFGGEEPLHVLLPLPSLIEYVQQLLLHRLGAVLSKA